MRITTATTFELNEQTEQRQTPIRGVTIMRYINLHFTYLLTYPFNGLFSRTTWVSRHQKGYTILDFNEARDGMKQETTGWQWHQLDYMQTIYTLLQTDNHTSNSSLITHG